MQFETIHSFLDGNGRVGQLLITLQLCHSGMPREPVLYLRLYFKRSRAAYYVLLDAVRRDGDWKAWLAFFLEGLRQTAEGAVTTARRLAAVFQEDLERMVPRGRRAGSAHRVHEGLKARPITSMQELRERSGLSVPATSSGMDLLVDLGIAGGLIGRRRNRIFAYDRYLTILNEGTETAGGPMFPSAAVLGTCDRHARRLVASLVERGVLTSDGPRAPLRLAFPAALASRWMPGFFPEQGGRGSGQRAVRRVA